VRQYFVTLAYVWSDSAKLQYVPRYVYRSIPTYVAQILDETPLVTLPDIGSQDLSTSLHVNRYCSRLALLWESGGTTIDGHMNVCHVGISQYAVQVCVFKVTCLHSIRNSNSIACATAITALYSVTT